MMKKAVTRKKATKKTERKPKESLAPKRSVYLTIWLYWLLVINVLGVLFYGIFSGFVIFGMGYAIPVWALNVLAVLCLLDFAFIIGLFTGRKYSFYAMCITSLIAIIINLFFVAPFSGIWNIIALVVLYLLLKRDRII